MGTISDQINTAFRDYATAGVASSGAHEVIKSEVREIGPLIEAAIANAGLGALVDVVYATRAELDADLAYDPDTVALVYGDATDANNDLYIKVGASGAGSWTLTTALHDIIEGLAQPYVDAAEAAQAAAEAAQDEVEAALSPLSDAIDVIEANVADIRHDDDFLARLADRALIPVAAYVDPGFGGASAGTFKAPWKTLADAISNTTAGDTIALMGEKPGGEPYVYLPATISTLSSRNVISYGGGGKAVIEGTADLSGETWTDNGNDVWYCDYTREEISKPGAITGSNVTLPQAFYENTALAWVRGNGSQAANITALESEESGFCYVSQTGSAEDILAATATTDVRIYVKLPGGIDPNGEDVRASTRSKATNFGAYRYNDLIFRGGDSKDLTGVGVYTEFPQMDNVEGQNAGEHIFVGLPRIRGRLKARGAIYTGRSGASLGRATVNAVTVYSNTDNGNYDCYIDYIDAENIIYAMFGHGVQSFRNLDIGRIRAINLQNIISSLLADGTRNPIFTGTFTIGEMYGRNIDQALDVAGNMVVSGVDVVFEDTPLDPTRQQLLVLQGTAPEITISGKCVFTLALGAGKARYLLRRNTDGTHTAPLVIFDAFTDESAAGYKGRNSRGGVTNENRIVIRNNSTLGDMMDQGAGTNWPSSFYLGPGCTSGFGDRTGPDCDTALAAAGLVEDEALALAGTEGYFYLDPQSTIVDRSDNVLSAPGWK